MVRTTDALQARATTPEAATSRRPTVRGSHAVLVTITREGRS